VAVFDELGKIFEDKKEDSLRPYFVFLMTDGHDTCNSERSIVTAKEHLQAKIEKFGGEVVFNVLGFSHDHNEDFLQSLALIGTSDGSYSFVSEKEGKKALQERLVSLVEATSSSIGRCINVEVITKNMELLGDWFGEVDKDVVLSAKMTKKGDGLVKIATRKFVRIPNGELPDMTIRVHEKLRGNTQPLEAKIADTEKVELSGKNDIDAFNMKKLRSALNMITSRLGDELEAKEEAAVKAGYVFVKNQMSKVKDVDTTNDDIKRHQDDLKGLVRQCEYVFEPGMGYDNERDKRCKGMMSVATTSAGQAQNMFRQRKMKSSGRSAPRTGLQMKMKQTDYSRYSDSD